VLATGLVGWAGTPGEFGNACETAERKRNAVVAREIVWALPYELKGRPDQQRAAVVEFAEWLRARHGVAVAWAIHGPPAAGDPRQYHAHLLVSTRRSTGDSLKEKTRELDTLETGRRHIEAWRQEAARIINRSLSRNGIGTSVDHRSHARQAQACGLPELLPQRKLGQAATWLERKGVATTVGDENRWRATFNEPALRWRDEAKSVLGFLKAVIAPDEQFEIPQNARTPPVRF
jgi:hypothetical protein